ncbi:unnamed protein product [Staphylococcus haemolyticus JCSC1435]|uniref:Uncharacterized protein n=1 Tax=Staphylococcus haemolyticus (strain JCSC1435) TaxID=279808 RepID=Q4L9K3_STAHJ|nr:unnamed protein product [Staphylococcus haemolyticus JCSC1435]
MRSSKYYLLVVKPT